MNVYGLVKKINILNDKHDSNVVYNMLHPEMRLNNVEQEDKLYTFMDFFFENEPDMLKKKISEQFFEYNKFKNTIQSNIDKNLTDYQKTKLLKMIVRLMEAEKKYSAYKKNIEGKEKLLNENYDIYETLYNQQADISQTCGEPLFEDNIISFCKVPLNIVDNCINVSNFVEYVALESDNQLHVNIKDRETARFEYFGKHIYVVRLNNTDEHIYLNGSESKN